MSTSAEEHRYYITIHARFTRDLAAEGAARGAGDEGVAAAMAAYLEELWSRAEDADLSVIAPLDEGRMTAFIRSSYDPDHAIWDTDLPQTCAFPRNVDVRDGAHVATRAAGSTPRPPFGRPPRNQRPVSTAPHRWRDVPAQHHLRSRARLLVSAHLPKCAQVASIPDNYMTLSHSLGRARSGSGAWGPRKSIPNPRRKRTQGAIMLRPRRFVAPTERRRIPKPIGALLSLSTALLLVFATATAAQAHVVYQEDEVWANTDSTKCLYTYAEVSHGSGAGYAKAYGLASVGDSLTETCILIWNRSPGQLKAGYQYFYWDGSQWGVCRQVMGDYDPKTGTWSGIANTTETSRVELTWDFGKPGLAPCGGGYYATKAGSTVHYGGTWYGGNVPVWSGNHFIEP